MPVDLNIERFYGWEAETRAGRVYASGLLNEGNRGGYPALPHAEIGKFTLFVYTHVPRPGENGSGLTLDLARMPMLTLHLGPDERIIYRRRVEMSTGGTVGLSSLELARGNTCILVGANRNIKGRIAQRLHWIYEATGEIHCTDRFNADDDKFVHPADARSWFYAPTTQPYEIP